MAEQFGVSRATVREALRTLEIGGILTLQKGVKGGAVIMRGDAKPITRTIEDLLLLGSLSLKDFTEARVCVQKEIIRLACERGTEEDFAAIETNIERTRQATLQGNIDKRLELTEEFYALLAAATKNGAMSVLMSAFTVPMTYYVRQIGHDRTWDVAASRRKFVGHLRKRDSKAASSEMMRHMQRLHDFLLSHELQPLRGKDS